MNNSESLTDAIFNINDEDLFEEAALRVFRHQFEHCSIYRDFATLLQRDTENVRRLKDIPFMPIEFFREFRVLTGELPNEHLMFESSGSGSHILSRHYISDPDLYRRSFTTGFQQFWGDPSMFRFIALLPGYLERSNSSLVYMVEHLISLSNDPGSGFFLHDHESLYKSLLAAAAEGRKTMLIGVTHALLDFIDLYSLEFKDLIIVETGGMKGRREELVREDLHVRLCESFGINKVASEYGMTELLSQAWSSGGGLFTTPGWMKVFIRDPNDPFEIMPVGRSGGINIIDLANIHSCAFIATQDLGRSHPDGSFEVLGRFDHSDLRGCNLMAV